MDVCVEGHLLSPAFTDHRRFPVGSGQKQTQACVSAGATQQPPELLGFACSLPLA